MDKDIDSSQQKDYLNQFMTGQKNLIDKHFSFLSGEQYLKLQQFLAYIKEWNQKLNLVSRTDIDCLFERHLVPSLSIAKICEFSSGSKILDVGTGGGFPGIPLAICFPKSNFLLIDSIGKKINAVQSIAQALDLKNVSVMHVRAEDLNEKFDFIIGRAVASLPKFVGWVKNKIRSGNQSTLANGILYLKGGDCSEEIKELRCPPTTIYPLGELFEGEFCQDKCVIYFDKKCLTG